MFVHYFTHVPMGLSQVEARLDEVRHNLTEMADVAYREGEALRSRVGPWEQGIAKEVSLSLGLAEIHSSGLVYPITWTASGAGLLFPELHAELILGHIGPAQTRLTVQGNYKPPLGFVGRVADRAVLGRYADATVRNWLDRLAEALAEDQVSSAAG